MKFLNKKIKKIIAAVLIFAAVIIIVILGFQLNNSSNVFECSVSKSDNGSIVLNTSMNELLQHNIEIGDGVNVDLSTGYKVEEVAILNGTFTNSGRHIIIVENENSKPVFQIQNKDNTWFDAQLDENSTAYLTLGTKAKFKDLNNALTRPLLCDDQNARSLRGGSLKLLDIFRGSPAISSGQISSIEKEFMKQLSINHQINLDDNSRGVKYFNIKDPNCNKMVVDTLLTLVDNNSRTLLISSNEDLTAYTSAIIEAIAGASYDEIVSDFMETYKNYYGITKEDTPLEYEAVKTYRIDALLHKLTKTTLDYDMHKCNFAYAAEMYLRAQQVHTSDIEKIKTRLCK